MVINPLSGAIVTVLVTIMREKLWNQAHQLSGSCNLNALIVERNPIQARIMRTRHLAEILKISQLPVALVADTIPHVDI
jgi:hypothetical protein